MPDVPAGAHVHPPPALTRTFNLPYQGGSVLHSNRAHLVFWQPAGSGLSYDYGYQSLTETFLTDVALDSHLPTNVYGLSGQYSDESGAAQYASTYAGAVTVTDPLPPNGCQEPAAPPNGTGPGWSVCLTDSQLVAELQAVVARYRLPEAGNDVYFLVLPQGLGSCVGSGPPGCALGGADDADSYCSYHSSDASGALLYGVIAYGAVPGHCQSDNPRPNGSAADISISLLSHEQNEAVTDPYGTAWLDQYGEEIGDLCLSNYGPTLGGSGSKVYDQLIHGRGWYLQEEWSNQTNSCQPRARADSASIRPTARIVAGRRLKITASARTVYGTIVHYDWSFGDRHSARAGRVTSHVYRRAGRYKITVRTTDSAGNWAFASRIIRIGKAPRRRPARRR